MTVSSNSTNGSPVISTTVNGAEGVPEIVEFELTGEPVQGYWELEVDSTTFGPFSWDASAYDVETALLGSYSVSGSNPWVLTSNTNTSLGTWSAQSDESDPLGAPPYIGSTSIQQDGAYVSVAIEYYEYDSLGRLITITGADPDGAGDLTEPVTHHEFDLAGNLVKVRDPLQLETTYEYDFLNRRAVSRDALGGETTFEYDAVGNLRYLSDPVSNTTEWVYDSLNRVVQEVNELNDSRFFTYDAAGNLIEKEDRLGRFTVYEYDNLHRQTAEEWWDDDIYPSIAVTTTTQGGGGNNEVQVVTLSNTTGGTFRLGFGGQTTTDLAWNASTSAVDTALEALSGAGTISVSGSAGGPYTITFTGAYANQNVATLHYRTNDLTNADLQRTISYTFSDDGDLEQVSDPDATYDYIYDEMGRNLSAVQNITGLNPEIKFENAYNAVSSRTELQAWFDSTKDFKNAYSYDSMQRLSSLTQQTVSSGNVVAPKRIEFAYNEINQFTSINRYAATSATEFVAASYFEYDDMNRLTKLVHSESTTAPTSGWGTDPLAGYQFSYDAASRFTSINSYLDGVTNYSHDDTNQLVDADHATATDESYEYDANGNRTMSGYSVASNNRMSSDGTHNYTYDDEGNRLTRTKISNGHVTRYEWDFRNRLVKVTEENSSSTVLQVTENFYDAGNQWVRRRFDSDGHGGSPFV